MKQIMAQRHPQSSTRHHIILHSFLEEISAAMQQDSKDFIVHAATRKPKLVRLAGSLDVSFDAKKVMRPLRDFEISIMF